ncbi:MAG: hypothetical protein WBL44_02165 [Nitrososphaeraceae archaeon]|jgi:hypothetical protein
MDSWQRILVSNHCVPSSRLDDENVVTQAAEQVFPGFNHEESE